MSKYRIILDGKTYEIEVEKVEDNTIPTKQSTSEPIPVQKSAPMMATPAASTVSKFSQTSPGWIAVKSPMPGTIISVNVALNEMVKQGQAILVLEAMKMENDIVAPMDGKLTALYVAQGDTVQDDAPLFEIRE